MSSDILDKRSFIMMDRKDYQIGENHLMNETFVISNIYADIEFLKYIDLGRVLSNEYLTESIYNRIVTRVMDDLFSLRKTNDLPILFKDIPDIVDLQKTNRHDDIIFRMSPSFDGAETFINSHITISDRCKRYFNKSIPNKMTINISSLPDLSETLKDHLRNEYEFIFEMPIEFVNIKEIDTAEYFLKFDIFYVGDFPQFNFKLIDLLNASKLIDKYIFCQKLLPLSQINADHHNDELLEKVFHNIELVMTAASRFHFIPPFQCLKRSIE